MTIRSTWLFFTLILFFQVQAFGFEEQSRVAIETGGNRNLVIEGNPFIYKCFGALELPEFQNSTMRVEKAKASELYLITFRFKAEADVGLPVAENQAIDLERDKDGFYNVSILRPGLEGEVSLKLRLEAHGEQVLYEIRAPESGNYARLIPRMSDSQNRRLCLRNQVWAGVGGTIFMYDQTIPALEANAHFGSLTLGSYHLEGRWYPSHQVGFLVSYKSAPGVMGRGEVQDVEETNFRWNTMEIASQYRSPNWMIDYKKLLIYPYLRGAFQHHSIPRLGIDPQNRVFFEQLEMLDLALGFGVNIFTQKNYFFEAYLNAKHPIYENNGSITPDLMFDGGIGFGRHIKKNFVLGAYWYGHWDKFRYENSGQRDVNQGNIDFIFSNFDIRIGYLF